ncbi:MAG TPA: ABC transporter permease [candidate division Zixibacteria bacterium]|nr:ABC transporter permease [candidate division Zixibacteria bacterium]
MRKLIESLGRILIAFVADIGGLFIMIWGIILSVPTIFKRIRLIFEQMLMMGVRSLPLVILTSVFTGSVTAWQAAYQFKGLVPLEWLGLTVAKTVFIELGPVLTSLVLAGRVGASIAAELGTMRVTEQIDALESMGINPVGYLVMPRLVAGMIMVPVLVMFANIIAILGGMVVAVMLVNISYETFTDSIKSYVYIRDVVSGLQKSVGFGAIIALMGCYNGFNAKGGAEGVGLATTRAVVLASVLILVSDYIMATILFNV